MEEEDNTFEASLKNYIKLIDAQGEIERKGKTTPYTSMNGHMFSFLSQEGSMGLRLSEEDRNTFIEQFSTKLMEQHGRTMKEFVEISAAVLQKPESLAEYLEKSVEYVAGLKPKPTKKK